MKEIRYDIVAIEVPIWAQLLILAAVFSKMKREKSLVNSTKNIKRMEEMRPVVGDI